jgi:hypothetical protein
MSGPGLEYTATARRLGILSAASVVVLLLAYAAALAVGLSSLESPDDPIGDPVFTILEVLILALTPAVVALMAAVHAWAPAREKSLSLAALAFMVVVAGVTSCVHFVILAVSRQPAFAGEPWLTSVFSFRWPSVVYALDILAWDVFFPLSMLFAAPAFRAARRIHGHPGAGRLAPWIRRLMIASGLLSLAGLAGVATGDMQVRNVGIAGYVGVFVVVAGLLAVFFLRTPPRSSDPADPLDPAAGRR